MTILPEPVALQFWSHQEITPEIRAQIEAILGGEPNGNCDNDSELCGGLRVAGVVDDEEQINPNIKQTPQGIWVLVNDSHISRWVEEHGSLFHDRQTLPLVLPEIPVGGIVVDVGANIGDSVLPFLERVGPTGWVYAFEPHPDAYECLMRNFKDAPNVSIDLNPLSDKSGETVFVVANENAGASYLSPAEDQRMTAAVRSAVQSVTLDEWLHGVLDRLDFIKIDVEGYELRVLKGAEQTINRFHPKMLIEVNKGALERQGATPEELFVWLDGRGYSHDIVQDDASFDSAQYDILCRHVAVSPAKQNSLAEIRSLAERLQKFCGTSAQTRLVRLELHKQGVIELSYRFKRRKKWRKRKAKA